jgi:hypothetical protein
MDDDSILRSHFMSTNIERQIPPISWWIFRDLEGTALLVSDEQPMSEVIQAPNGVWIGKIVRPNPDTYEILKRVFPTREEIDLHNESYSTNVESVYTLAATVHRITKVDYETYLEFGLFDAIE